VVGRAPTCDIPIIDPTISRRHAEVECGEGGVTIRDLGSSNGTFVNGTRIEASPVGVGDVVTFGKVGFRLTQVTAPAPAVNQSSPGATIVRQLPVRDPSASLPGRLGTPARANAAAPSEVDKSREKLAKLLEVSKGLGRAADIDTLLNKIVDYAYQILEV